MNNPEEHILRDVEEILKRGFDFVEVTLEWPGAMPDEETLRGLSQLLSSYERDAVIHAPWYLELASPYHQIARGALEFAEVVLKAAQMLEAPFATFHPFCPGWLSRKREEAKRLNAEAFRRLVSLGEDFGVRIHVENVDHGAFSSVGDILFLLNSVPELSLTLDIGHANLGGSGKIRSYIEKAGSRILHVHAHDNDGRSDLHLPVGAGRIDWPGVLSALRSVGYEGTVTLEPHVRDYDYLTFSRRKFLEYWGVDG